MKLKLAALAASTGLATSAFLAAVPVGAQEALPLTVTPTSGSDAVFTVSGTDCISDETGPGVIDVFVDGQALVNDDPNNPDLAEDDGTWVIEVSPADPSAPLEPGVLEITATCTVNDGADPATTIVTYAPASYEIVAAEAPVDPAPAPEAPPAAEPVVAEPTFTG